jgi:hypothetical protein
MAHAVRTWGTPESSLQARRVEHLRDDVTGVIRRDPLAAKRMGLGIGDLRTEARGGEES